MNLRFRQRLISRLNLEQLKKQSEHNSCTNTLACFHTGYPSTGALEPAQNSVLFRHWVLQVPKYHIGLLVPRNQVDLVHGHCAWFLLWVLGKRYVRVGAQWQSFSDRVLVKTSPKKPGGVRVHRSYSVRGKSGFKVMCTQFWTPWFNQLWNRMQFSKGSH